LVVLGEFESGLFEGAEAWPQEERTGRSRSGRPWSAERLRAVAWWRGIVLIAAALFFLIPLYAALRFSLTGVDGGFSFAAYEAIPSQLGFTAALWLSVRLAFVTTIITLALMVPTSVYVHLRLPRLRRTFDAITIVPIVIPPVVLIVGVLQVAPTSLKSTPYLLALVYAVLAMPFVYRSLDAGLRAIDLHTLVEASRSLGGRWSSTLWRVVMPNLRTGLLSATVLTVALVLGEFTMASLDLYQTIPVWIVNFQQDDGHVSTAVSLLALVVTWVVLLVISSFDLRRIRRTARSGKDA
jgi:putative spermidine/putrescine transport system permease protein